MTVGTPIDPHYGGIEGECKNPIQRKEWLVLAPPPDLPQFGDIWALIQLAFPYN